MILRAFFGCLFALLVSSTAWALDEAILTPTNDSVKSAEDEAFLGVSGFEVGPLGDELCTEPATQPEIPKRNRLAARGLPGAGNEYTGMRWRNIDAGAFRDIRSALLHSYPERPSL